MGPPSLIVEVRLMHPVFLGVDHPKSRAGHLDHLPLEAKARTPAKVAPRRLTAISCPLCIPPTISYPLAIEIVLAYTPYPACDLVAVVPDQSACVSGERERESGQPSRRYSPTQPQSHKATASASGALPSRTCGYLEAIAVE